MKNMIYITKSLFVIIVFCMFVTSLDPGYIFIRDRGEDVELKRMFRYKDERDDLMDLIKRNPIKIDNDTEMITMAADEGWEGNGTALNPYIIQGYEIDGTDHGYGIYVGNTTLIFKIQDSVIKHTGINYDSGYFDKTGAYLFNTSHCVMDNITSYSNKGNGIFISESNNISISSTSLNNNSEDGISIEYASDIAVSDCIIEHNDLGAYITKSERISLESSNYSSNKGRGVDLMKSYHVDIKNNSFSGNKYGLYIELSQHNCVIGNRFSNESEEGITLSHSLNNTFEKNIIMDMKNGYMVKYSSHENTFINNDIRRVAGYPIYIYSSNYNILNNNEISDSEYLSSYIINSHGTNISNNFIKNNSNGIKLSRSTGCKIYNNSFVNVGIYFYGVEERYWISHDMGLNTVNGKKLEFIKNSTGEELDGDIGSVILVNCSDMVLEDMNFSDTDMGIGIAFSKNVTISDNSIYSNYYGMYILASYNTTIHNNTVGNCSEAGVLLYNDTYTYLLDNIFLSNGLNIYGDEIEHWNTHEISTTNIVNGRSLLYVKDAEDQVFEGNHGQVILANCSDSLIRDQSIHATDTAVSIGFCDGIGFSNNVITQNSVGVYIYNSTEGRVDHNDIQDNNNGIQLYVCKNQNVSDNNISSNNNHGIYKYRTIESSFYRNNITNNERSVFSYLSQNNTFRYNNFVSNSGGLWLSPSTNTNNDIINNNFINETGEIYTPGVENRWNGSYRTGGNYWSGYQGKDRYSGRSQDVPGMDSIGDWGYNITSQARDDYPQMHRYIWWKDVAPRIEPKNPMNGTISSINDRIGFDIWDGNYDLDITGYRVNSSSEKNFDENFTIDISSWPQGNYTLIVFAEDERGEKTIEEYVFYLDRTPPYLNITSPLNNAYIAENAVTVEWITYDNITEVSHIKIEFDDQTFSLPGATSSWALEDLSDGTYIIYITSFDTTGNNKTERVVFYVDTVRPSLDILTPTDMEIFDYKDVVAEWTSYDNGSGINHFEIRINQGGWYDVGTSNKSMLWDLKEGDNTLEVMALDRAGNVAMDTSEFLVDTTSPNLSIHHPLDGSYISEDEVTINWTGEDATSGIDYYMINLNDGSWSKTNYTNYTYRSLSDHGNSRFTVKIKAVDEAGNSILESVDFSLDLTPPSIYIISPSGGNMLNDDSLLIKWSGFDLESGISEYAIKVDDGEWISIGLNTSYTCDLESLEEGEHTVWVKGVNNAMNEANSTVTFLLDTTPPTLDIISPSQTYLNTNKVTIRWESEDDVSGVDSYRLYIDGVKKETILPSKQFITLDLSPGEHNITLEAIDRVGNIRMKSVDIFIDTSAPHIEIIEPSEGSVLNSNTVRISWRGHDVYGEIDHYQIMLDGGEWIHKGLANEHIVSNLSEGEHVVEVRGVDMAENTGWNKLTFTINITDDLDGDGIPDYLQGDRNGEYDDNKEDLPSEEKYSVGKQLLFLSTGVLILTATCIIIHLHIRRKRDGVEESLDNEYRSNYFHKEKR